MRLDAAQIDKERATIVPRLRIARMNQRLTGDVHFSSNLRNIRYPDGVGEVVFHDSPAGVFIAQMLGPLAVWDLHPAMAFYCPSAVLTYAVETSKGSSFIRDGKRVVLGAASEFCTRVCPVSKLSIINSGLQKKRCIKLVYFLKTSNAMHSPL